MKYKVLIALFSASINLLAFADSNVSGGEVDPRIRAAYFNARTHRPFDALTGLVTYAQQSGGKIVLSPEMKMAFQSAVNELGVNLSRLEFPAESEFKTSDNGIENAIIYDNYNRGVSQLKSKNPLEGVKILSAISADEFYANDEILLKDKTNLTLGYFFLESGDNVAAANYFRQVRRLSIYANRALVGLGWALLSPNTGLEKKDISSRNTEDALAGDYLWSGSDDDIAWARREAPFRRAWAIAKGEKEKDLRAAMVPWMELISRDPLDPAVQEVMLIIPYLMLHWDGQGVRSEQYYSLAVSRLKQAISDLKVIEKDILSGGLVASIRAADTNENSGWEIWLSDLTANRLGGYVALLLDAPGFRDALQEFRQLDIIQARLVAVLGDSAVTSGVSSQNDEYINALAVAKKLIPQIEAYRYQWAESLNNIALAQVLARRERSEAYFAEAEFALARNYERLRRQLLAVEWSDSES